MAFDESLAARIREALERTKGVEEKKMFGDGEVLVGRHADRLELELGGVRRAGRGHRCVPLLRALTPLTACPPNVGRSNSPRTPLRTDTAARRDPARNWNSPQKTGA